MLDEQDEKIERLFRALEDIDRDKIGPDSLEKKVSPVVEKILTAWLAKLNKLEIKVTDKTVMMNSLSKIIIELLENKANASREEMARAIYPVIALAIQKQMEESPEPVVDVLYPIIGQVVSRYVSSALKELTARIDSRLESTLSLRRWKTRWQARRLGIPESVLLLRRSLSFVIEEVFLIQKDSGLLIAHASRNPEQESDRDLVGGMLTAIRDFVSTSFASREKGSLETIQYGELNIMLEEMSYCYLAIVFHGSLPENARENFMETLGLIHREYGARLKKFSGDPSETEGIEELLAKRFLGDPREEETGPGSGTGGEGEKAARKGFLLKGVLGFVLPVALLASSYWLYWNFKDGEIRARSLETIRQNRIFQGIDLRVRVQRGAIVVYGLMPSRRSWRELKARLEKIPDARTVRFVGSNLENYITEHYRRRAEEIRIQFPRGRVAPDRVGRDGLRNLVFLLRNINNYNLLITVSNDDQGALEVRRKYSMRRARGLQKVLIDYGLPAARIIPAIDENRDGLRPPREARFRLDLVGE